MKWQRASFLVAAPLLMLLVLRVGWGFNGLYGQDAHEYFRFATAIREWMLGGPHPGSFFWPVTYPLLVALVSLLTGTVSTAAQAVSALALGFSALAIRKLLMRLNPTQATAANAFVWAFGLLAPYMLRAGTVVMSDMLAVAFVSWALWFAVAWWKSPSTLRYTAFAALTVMAISTRYQAAIVLFVPHLVLGWLLLKQRKFVQLLPALVLCAVLAVPHVYFQQSNALSAGNHYGLQLWSAAHWFQRTFEGPDGVLAFTYPNLLFTLSSLAWPGTISLGVVLLFFARRVDWQQAALRVALMAFLVNALFLAGVPFQNTRHLLLAMPLAAVLLFPAFARLVHWLPWPMAKRLFLPTLLLGQLALCVWAMRPTVASCIEQQQITLAIHARSDDAPVYTFAMEMALETYNVPNPVRNIYHELYEEFEIGGLLLVNNRQFAPIFEGRNPMLNWQAANKQHQLELLQAWDSGWELYRISTPK